MDDCKPLVGGAGAHIWQTPHRGEASFVCERLAAKFKGVGGGGGGWFLHSGPSYIPKSTGLGTGSHQPGG